MKTAILIAAFFVTFAAAFVAGVIIEQHFGIISASRPIDCWQYEDVKEYVRNSYVEGYYEGAKGAIGGRFKQVNDPDYKEALTWRLEHPSFPFIIGDEPGH